MQKDLDKKDSKMIYWSQDRKFVEREFKRMGFDKDARWRISDTNKDFELCNTYPQFLIIPSSFKDEDLESVAKFRYFRRIPTAVWRHIKNGCFIVRSSQPTVGWFGWFRNELDENLVQSYVNNTMMSISERLAEERKRIGESENNSVDHCDQESLVEGNEGKEDTAENKKAQQNSETYPSQERLEAKLENSNYNNNLQDTTKLTGNEQEARLGASPNISNGLSPEISPLQLTTPIVIGNGTSNGNGNGNATGIGNGNGNSNGGLPQDNNISPVGESNIAITTTSKMLIIDARSYTAAMANRAKGGGCECSEYYQRCEVQFMNLANIHSIRKSFHAIRSVCEAYSEQSNNWLSFLDNSRWLHHISGLLKSALLIVDTIDLEEKSILIHCSDGWDRTPQLVALAEIMLDPHYRTFDGFRTLVQREWLDFGHKFADRCGSNPCNEDPNERCPVFLQWLDCIQQLLVQYPEHFEFNSLYLDKLNRHTYSNIFGTFSYNSTQERILCRVEERIFSLWSYFDSSRRRFRNEKYVASDQILRPSYKVRDLHFWKEVYLPPLRNPTPYIPIANNIDNKKFYDSLCIDSLTRTV